MAFVIGTRSSLKDALNVKPPKRQHLVTKAILRKFADPTTGQLEAYFRDKGRVRPTGPNGVCYVEFFIRQRAQEAEDFWGRFETGLGYFYRSLFSGRLIDDERALGTARLMLALHSARSHTYIDIANKSLSQSKEKVTRELVEYRASDLVAQIQGRSSFLIPITSDLLMDEATKAVARNSIPLEVGGEFFLQRLVTHFNRALDIMEKIGAGIEVLIPDAEDREFVISDNPVMTPAADGSKGLGPDEGVGWLNAGSFGMPLSPRHLIAVAPASNVVAVDGETVEFFNQIQVRRMHNDLVARPGSGLAQWAKKQDEGRNQT